MGVAGRLPVSTRRPGGGDFVGGIAAMVDISVGVEPVTVRSIDYALHATGFVATDFIPPGQVLAQLVIARKGQGASFGNAFAVGSDDPAIVRFRGTVSGTGRIQFDASERDAPVSGLLLEPGTVWSVFLSTPSVIPQVVVPGGLPALLGDDRPWSTAWLAVRYDAGGAGSVGMVSS